MHIFYCIFITKEKVKNIIFWIILKYGNIFGILIKYIKNE